MFGKFASQSIKQCVMDLSKCHVLNSTNVCGFSNQQYLSCFVSVVLDDIDTDPGASYRLSCIVV